MSRITVIGGTGYAGSAIVTEAAARGHQVTVFSRSLPAERVPGVNYVQGDATDEAALAGPTGSGRPYPKGGPRKPRTMLAQTA